MYLFRFSFYIFFFAFLCLVHHIQNRFILLSCTWMSNFLHLCSPSHIVGDTVWQLLVARKKYTFPDQLVSWCQSLWNPLLQSSTQIRVFHANYQQMWQSVSNQTNTKEVFGPALCASLQLISFCYCQQPFSNHLGMIAFPSDQRLLGIPFYTLLLLSKKLFTVVL